MGGLTPSKVQGARCLSRATATAALAAATMSLNPHPQRTTTHGRSPSGRVPLTRRMTKGPLDVDVGDDPLALASAPSSTHTSSNANTPARVLSPARSPRVTPGPAPEASHGHGIGIQEPPSLDVSFLQDPSAYHVLPVTAPLPFQQTASVPSVAAPIDSLLLAGHYRLDAVRAHLLEMAGDHDAAIQHYQAAAAHTTNIPERNYLTTKASQLRSRLV